MQRHWLWLPEKGWRPRKNFILWNTRIRFKRIPLAAALGMNSRGERVKVTITVNIMAWFLPLGIYHDREDRTRPNLIRKCLLSTMSDSDQRSAVRVQSREPSQGGVGLHGCAGALGWASKVFVFSLVYGYIIDTQDVVHIWSVDFDTFGVIFTHLKPSLYLPLNVVSLFTRAGANYHQGRNLTKVIEGNVGASMGQRQAHDALQEGPVRTCGRYLARWLEENYVGPKHWVTNIRSQGNHGSI